jgi:hypothetical protein
VGPAHLANLGCEQAKLDLQNVTGAVGRAHDWDSYVACSGVLGKLGAYTFRGPNSLEPLGSDTDEQPSGRRRQSWTSSSRWLQFDSAYPTSLGFTTSVQQILRQAAVGTANSMPRSPAIAPPMTTTRMMVTKFISI